MSLENAKENLAEFGKELGLEGLEFDENNTCILGIDDEFSMHLTYEPNSDRLYLYSPLLDGLPKDNKICQGLYERLLEGSMLGGQMAGGGVGVAVKEELILMHCTIDMEHAILEAVPSPSNGVTYCQGMYIFGEDPHTPDETWGMDRIFFCHARNLIRHGPAFWEYEEVPLDKGDVDIAKCVRALMDARYEGVMIPEHLGEGTSLAESVAYLKGLINL